MYDVIGESLLSLYLGTIINWMINNLDTLVHIQVLTKESKGVNHGRLMDSVPIVEGCMGTTGLGRVTLSTQLTPWHWNASHPPHWLINIICVHM